MISRWGERGKKRRLTGRGSEESIKLEADGDDAGEEDHGDLGVPWAYVVDVEDGNHGSSGSRFLRRS